MKQFPIIKVSEDIENSLDMIRVLGNKSAARAYVDEKSPLYSKFLNAYDLHKGAMLEYANGSTEIAVLTKIPTSKFSHIITIDPVMFTVNSDAAIEEPLSIIDRRAAIKATKEKRNIPL